MKTRFFWLMVKLLVALICVASYAGTWLYAAFLLPGMYLAILGWHVLGALLLGWYLSQRPGVERAGTHALFWILWLLWTAVAVLGLILGPVLNGHYPLTIMALPFVIVLVAFLVQIIRSDPDLNAPPDDMRIGRGLPSWNVKKGLSGTIFGDSANFVAVVAGLSGYKILGDLGSGWWYLGLTGGWLALLVGLSLHARWLRQDRSPLRITLANPNGWADPLGKAQNPDVSFEQRGAVVVSELVGLVTILSMLAPTSSNHTLVRIGGFVSAGLLLAFAIGSWVYAARVLGRIPPGDEERRPVKGSAIWTVAVQFVAAGFAIWFAVEALGEPASIAGGFVTAATALGIVGAICWLLAELFSSWSTTKAWMQAQAVELLGYLKWEKNLWEILGALLAVVYLGISLSEPPPPAGQAPPPFVLEGKTLWTSILFFCGALLGSIGTIRGIVAGILGQIDAGGGG